MIASLLLAAALGAACVTVVAYLLISRDKAARQARAGAMQSVARRYALGDLSRPAPDYGDDDLGGVARAMDAAVHELGQRVNALARDRARMEAILASMVEGVLVVDGQGRLQLVNEAARNLLKLEREASGRPYVEAIRHPAIVEQIARAMAGGPTEGIELSLALDRNRTLVGARGPGGGRGPRRGARAARHHRPEERGSDPPRLRRQRLARTAHAADRHQGLRRSAGRRPRR